MSNTEVLMPRMGESVNEATIIKWVKNEGDPIKADETIVEIATDKVDSEIPSPSDGILIKKLCKEGDIVPVGKAIAIISSNISEAVEAPAAPVKEPEKATVLSESPKEELPLKKGFEQVISRFSSSGKFYSPLVRTIAKKEGITTVELETIPGSGKAGRVTKNDLLAYLPARQSNGAKTSTAPKPAEKIIPVAEPIAPVTIAQTPAVAKPASKPLTVGPNDEIIEMDRMRRLIAQHMVMSKQTSPHVTSYVEADVTGMVQWREKVKKEFEKKEGEKLTFTPLFVDAVVKAIKDFPMVNVSVDGTRIIRHKDINIGIAVALPTGNLIVPVIKNADQKNLLGLTKQVNDLAGRARKNRLLPDDTQGGTFTITNVGTFGNIMGTPIINQPQAAILATGIIKKKPVVIESPSGDVIGIRHMMYLSLAYDHRVIDGALGGSFLKRIADYMEGFNMDTTIL